MSQKSITLNIQYEEQQRPLAERIALMLVNIPLDMLKCPKGKIEIDWAEANVIYKATSYKNIT